MNNIIKKKSLSILTALVLILAFSISAFAAWPSFQGNNDNNGVITDVAPLLTGGQVTQGSNLKVVTGLPSGMLSGIDVVPVINDEGGVPYAYIFYSGSSTSNLTKLNLATGSFYTGGEWQGVSGIQITPNSQFQISTPAIDGDDLYLGTVDFVQKLNDDDFSVWPSSDWTISPLPVGVTLNTRVVGGVNYLELGGSSASRFTVTLTQNIPQMGPSTSMRVATEIEQTGSPLMKGNVDIRFNGASVLTAIYRFPSGDRPQYINENFTATPGATNTIAMTLIVEPFQAGASIGIPYIELYQQDTVVKKVSGISTDTPVVTNVGSGVKYSGQIDTPIKVTDEYVYFGAFRSPRDGEYFQIEKATGATQTFTPSPGSGYYWAGAAIIENDDPNIPDYVVFTGDAGYLYSMEVGANFGTPISQIDISQYGNVGRLRSSVAHKRVVYDEDGNYADYLYFPTQGDGLLLCFMIDASGVLTYGWHDIVGYSTSTPVISDNDRLYVGSSGDSDGNSVFCFTDIYPDPTPPTPPPPPVPPTKQWGYRPVNPDTGLVDDARAVQSSPLVYSDVENGVDYIYFTTNASDGSGYCISDAGGAAPTTEWYVYDANLTYTLQGMAASSGYLVYGNDYSVVYIVNP
jgi:hypothetical protein